MNNEQIRLWLTENLKRMIDDLNDKQKFIEFCIEILYRLEHNLPWDKSTPIGWKQMGRELGFTL